MKASIKVFSFVVLTFLAASGQKKYDEDENRAYEFGFKIAGEQHRHEKKDVNGIIEGEFGFITADGIYHVTVYATDENGDFHILSMRNVRISAPLDGSPLPPGAKISGQPGEGGAAPVQPSTQRPFQTGLTTKNPKAPYAFTTQPTIKPACGGCGYVTTPKPRPGEKFPFQNPKFQNQNPNAISNEPYSSNPNGPGSPNQNIPSAPGSPYQNTPNAPGNPYQNTPNAPGSPDQNNLNVPGSPYQNTPNAPGSPYQNTPNAPGSPYQNTPNAPESPYQNSPNAPGSPYQNIPNPAAPGNLVNPADPNEKLHYPVDDNNNPAKRVGGLDIRYQEQGHPQPPNSINPLSSNPQAPGLNQRLSEIKNPDGSPYYPNQRESQPNYSPGQSYPQTPSKVTVDNNVIHVPGNPDIPIRDKYPGMVDGLPNGIEQKDISDLLYKFNYTVGFHGHYETGYKNGAKVGGYFVNGRDGISRIVTYVADENGYRPKVKFVRLGLDSDDTPKEATEKSFGLKNFEFVWYPVK